MRSALKRFAENVDQSPGQSVIAVVFGMGGGTGSGIVMDMARHLSNISFGRRALVVGVWRLHRVMVTMRRIKVVIYFPC